MVNNPEQAERLEVERDYYRSLPVQQFRDLVEEQIPRLWRTDPLVIDHDLQDAYWQSNHAIVVRLRSLAEAQIKAQWTEQGIWKDPWDRKHAGSGEYQIEGGWPHQLHDGTGGQADSPQRSPGRVKWRSAKKRREEFDRSRAVMEDGSRPFQMFVHQLMRERERLDRCGCLSAPADTLSSKAYANVRESWVKRRIWLRSWDPMPGMTWGHEKPLCEFIAGTRPELPALCVEGRAQRWAEELVGTRELGTWERDADVRGLAWTVAPRRDPGQDPSVLMDPLPVVKELGGPPEPPGLFGKVDNNSALARAPPAAITANKPVTPSWGLAKLHYTEDTELKKLDFKKFNFPWDMPLLPAYYRDRRFKAAVARRLRSDFDSAAEAEDYWEMEHLKATQGAGWPAEMYCVTPREEDEIARRYEAFRAWEKGHAAQLRKYHARFKAINWADFQLPDGVLIGTEHWADHRFREEIMRRIPGLTRERYEEEHWRRKERLLVPVEEDWTIGVEAEDELQRRWEAQKKQGSRKRRREPRFD